ncbi:hypothetical protein HDU87_003238 [Geranomyces variabilis]|uniref:Uncharacterized protein n=1 Tax=Geranomyces variabilis TaxID=109894 RepID=A0AAD5XNB0_9FUNG|nr:hypothetical protein HDU87_003238 [Geranomyces variabilis]
MISHISPSIYRESMSSPAPAIKPRRKPVNYDGIAAAPINAPPTTGGSAVLGPRKFEASSGRIAVSFQGGTTAVESPGLPHRVDHSTFPVQNPLPPPPRRATIVSTRSGLKPVAPGPPYVARSASGEEVAHVAKKKKRCSNTDGVHILEWPDQVNATATTKFKELTADIETRRLEQQDLHAAIELLVRRTAALEQQVFNLGAQPVTKTDTSLSEARLEEIASGVWKKFEHLSGKVDSSTCRTNSVMTDILAKTREIRRHLSLSLSGNGSPDASTTSVKLAAPAAEESSPASSPIPSHPTSTNSIDLPNGPPPPPPPKKKKAAAIVERMPSPVEQRTAKPHAVPECDIKEDAAASAEKPTIAARAAPVEIAVPTKITIVQPAAAVAAGVTPKPESVAVAENPTVDTTKSEGAFADDLLAIMNDFGF